MDDIDLDAPPRRRPLGALWWAVYPWASLALHLVCIAGMLACFAGFVLEAEAPPGVHSRLVWLGGIVVFVAIRILDAVLWTKVIAPRA